jgi:hypothetical protein
MAFLICSCVLLGWFIIKFVDVIIMIALFNIIPLLRLNRQILSSIIIIHIYITIKNLVELISLIKEFILNLSVTILNTIVYWIKYFWNVSISYKILLFSLSLYFYNFLICIKFYTIIVCQFLYIFYNFLYNFNISDINVDLFINIFNLEEFIKFDSLYKLINLLQNLNFAYYLNISEIESDLFNDCWNNNLKNLFNDPNNFLNYSYIDNTTNSENNPMNNINNNNTNNSKDSFTNNINNEGKVTNNYSKKNDLDSDGADSDNDSLFNLETSTLSSAVTTTRNMVIVNDVINSQNNNMTLFDLENLQDPGNSSNNNLVDSSKNTSETHQVYTNNEKLDENNNLNYRVYSRYVINGILPPNGTDFTKLLFDLDVYNDSNTFNLTKPTRIFDYTQRNPLNILTALESESKVIDSYSVKEQINYYNKLLSNKNFELNIELNNFIKNDLLNLESNKITDQDYIKFLHKNNLNSILNTIQENNSNNFTELIELLFYNDLTSDGGTCSENGYEYEISNNINSYKELDSESKNENKNIIEKNNIDNTRFYNENLNNTDINKNENNYINNNGNNQYNNNINNNIKSDLKFYFPEDRDLSEILTIKNFTAETYLGAVDVFGNIHLSAAILDNPYYNLKPGIDFIEGFDSYVVYDHDSVYFKPMIDSAYKAKQQDTILDFFDSLPDTWYNIANREAARNYIFELIQKNSGVFEDFDSNVKFDMINSPKQELKLFDKGK